LVTPSAVVVVVVLQTHHVEVSLTMAELESQPKAVQSLYGWFNEGKLYVNRRYQRKLVWTLEEKQKLIESILNRYPVPAILLAERERGAYEIIDGLQRLHTLVSFVEMAFPDLDNKYFKISDFPTAQTRANNGDFQPPVENVEFLTSHEVSTFLDYSLAISVMRGASEAEIDDVFSRINTYGHRLSDQERRQAGVRDSFSTLVRDLACEIRGDVSSDILRLSQMPSISIDLPMTKHGYEVIADSVFWVKQGILRSTDLRDSMDEQCLADIAACIVGGEIIERSKEALDEVYEAESPKNQQIVDALISYGADKFADELKYCIDELLAVCQAGGPSKLRNIVFDKPSTNAFPSVFAILMIALHESLVTGRKKISNHASVRRAISGLYGRIDTSRKSTAAEERRKNVDTIKGLIGNYLIVDEPKSIYGAHSTVDIDSTIRRSEIELPHYELKQGALTLDDTRSLDRNVFQKVINTICAIANNGKERSGSIIIGVTDRDSDAARVKKLDGIEARVVGRRHVVGVKREARQLREKPEQYFTRWREAIKNSELTRTLRDDVLANIDYNEYYGLGLIIITIPAQKSLSFVGSKLYRREADETVEVTDPPHVAEIAARFN